MLNYLVLRRDRLVIPQSMRDYVLHLAHEDHQGIVKTKNCLRAKVWWPKMDAATEKLCRSCHGYQMVGELSAPELMQHVELLTGKSFYSPIGVRHRLAREQHQHS